MSEPDRPLRALVRRALGRALAERGIEAESPSERPAGVAVTSIPAPGPDRPGADGPLRPRTTGAALVSADCLAETPDGGAFAVPHGARVTPLARDEAFRRGIRLGRGTHTDAGPKRVAIGADHGGFALKQDVAAWLTELGHRPLDLGTHDTSAVDYPDFARAVAEAVADGRADLGVVVDGAGIGSAMAANKVPRVRAANCWNERAAKNAREHNHANVLTLGAGMVGAGEAYSILRTFLATPVGEGRHARRAAKIDEVEVRWSGRPEVIG